MFMDDKDMESYSRWMGRYQNNSDIFDKKNPIAFNPNDPTHHSFTMEELNDIANEEFDRIKNEQSGDWRVYKWELLFAVGIDVKIGCSVIDLSYWDKDGYHENIAHVNAY